MNPSEMRRCLHHFGSEEWCEADVGVGNSAQCLGLIACVGEGDLGECAAECCDLSVRNTPGLDGPRDVDQNVHVFVRRIVSWGYELTASRGMLCSLASEGIRACLLLPSARPSNRTSREPLAGFSSSSGSSVCR